MRIKTLIIIAIEVLLVFDEMKVENVEIVVVPIRPKAIILLII